MTGLGVVLILAGLILFFAGLGQSAQNKAFAGAQDVVGRVIDKRKREQKNGTAYDLTVTYAVGNAEYNKDVSVKLSEFNKISEGDGFNLKYLPDKPYKATNPDALNPQKARTVLILGVVLACVGAVVLLIARFCEVIV